MMLMMVSLLEARTVGGVKIFYPCDHCVFFSSCFAQTTGARGLDVLALLVSIYGSTDLFVSCWHYDSFKFAFFFAAFRSILFGPSLLALGPHQVMCIVNTPTGLAGLAGLH